MNENICAAIDVGSNSVRLMVARTDGDRLSVLKTGLITTRLMNGVENGILSPESIERTALAVAEHAASALSLGATLIHAFGTSALRDAKNSAAFSARTEQLCGVHVNVISGVECPISACVVLMSTPDATIMVAKVVRKLMAVIPYSSI